MRARWAAVVGAATVVLGCAGRPATPKASGSYPAQPPDEERPEREAQREPQPMPQPEREPPPQPGNVTEGGGVDETRAPEAPRQTPRCPDEMALVERPQGPYCIDRWEAGLVLVSVDGTEQRWPNQRRPDRVEEQVRAVSQPNRYPQGFVSGHQAALACARAGKRLCEIDEWVRACRGPRNTTYPYGNERLKNVCNDRFDAITRHPVVRLYRREAGRDADPQGMWHPKWMNDPRLYDFDHTLTRTGEKSGCTNGYGVYDMVGNLHEWVADPEGTFFGGFFLDTYQNGEGCEYRTVFHPFGYHDYSTGFRCCADAEWGT